MRQLGNGFDSIEGLVDFLVAFKLEGDGDDADSEDAALFGFVSNDRCSTGAGASSHTSGDEDHFGVGIEEIANLLNAFVGGLACAFGAVACAQTVFAELHFVGNGGVLQGFGVGVAHGEVDFLDACAVHIVDRITTATTYTNDFDDAGGCCGISHINDEVVVGLLLLRFFRILNVSFCLRLVLRLRL